MTPLSMDYVKGVCKIGEGAACCRYLLMGTQGFECGKHQTWQVKSLAGDGAENVKALMDARVAAGTMVAQGDNCDGFLPPPQV
jgi:hypothetical protein